MAVLGMETSSGDFEVIDLCFAGLPDLYTPKPSTSTNGKGKGRAEDSEEMEVDGMSIILGEIVQCADIYRRCFFRQDLGRDGFGTVDGCAGGAGGSKSRDDGRVAYGRGWRVGGMGIWPL
jgi:DNA polymerase delta subunit 2